jgi:archaellum biogenesis ATPase FlaH
MVEYGRLIRLINRSFTMLKSEMVKKNPLRAFDQHSEGGLEPGQAGLVAARAGTGKTALLIQIALDNLFRGNSVVHITIGETVNHVQAWYEEIFRDLAAGYDLEESRAIWEEALANRLILTFRAEAFTADTLKERLNDLIEQNVFTPNVIVLDGLDNNEDNRKTLEDIKAYVRDSGRKAWVSTRTHRADGELKKIIEPISDLFEVTLGIEPEGNTLCLTDYKKTTGSSVKLDTKTLLLVSDS